ncbi:MAG: Phosphate regulon transcriptional regulatory protein PhoB [Myxococcaceae bacterium]|nr:Phosphate regulon transcriptional regulatory protein PhoB [Myxococcaceae bacterium]
MAQRVLVFEKDTDFVRELQNGFGAAGVEVEVVRDPDLAIQRTRQGDVGLILLSVESMETSGEAFLVCKRFKSDDDLAKVPFVIMGGAQHAEAFESHKKLKKRKADEYVQLPTSFQGLYAVVAPLLGLSASSEEASAAEVSVEVDDDIDAFADNAFGELVRGGAAEPASQEAGANDVPTPAASDIDAAELEALRQRAEEAELRVQDAELRALRASEDAAEAARRVQDGQRRVEEQEQHARELEAKIAEVSARADAAEQRAKAPAPVSSAQPGVSSRDYLDLREQLNRKDKELLALRDEVTQRDRQLIDGSDRSLQLERAQAELHDSLTATQRQLEDAQTKIRAYEVDREAVTKRLEDFRGRLARAEEKGKRVEDELDALKTSSARELYDLKMSHEQAVTSRAQASAAELERLRGVHLAEQSALVARSQKELADLQLTREHDVETLKGVHERALRDLRNTHTSELELQKQAGLAALSEAVDKAEAEQARALDALANEHAQDIERRAAEADRARAAAVAGVERELEAKYGAARKELEDRHASAESALQKKLAEAESLASVLSDRITEIEQAKQELEGRLSTRIGSLEGELSARTQERDTAHNELSAMRASIASLERTGAQLSDRLSALEADLGRANDRIDQQSAKIALDKELLDRVRRALGIGIGLLEQQKHNVV